MSEPEKPYVWLKPEDYERLIRERDEARAAVTTANFVVAEYQRDLAEAEQRGYRRGVQDAAKVAGSHDGCCEDFADCGYCTKAHILALLEQTGPGEKK